ncbi:hypothetical protein H0H93_012200, partial [Arthromyces matolae]
MPKRLLYGNPSHYSNRPSITQLEERVEKLKEQRDRTQGTAERALLSSRLATANHNLKQERIMQEIEAGRNPRKAEDLYGGSTSIGQKTTAERRVKRLAELERTMEEEQDPDQLKKLKNNFSCIRSRMRKAQKKKTQQSHEPHNGNAKADESRVGQTSEGAHMTENSDSNGVQLPGAGLEADQELSFLDWDMDLGVSDCSGNNFDNYIQNMSDEEFRKWFETMEE